MKQVFAILIAVTCPIWIPVLLVGGWLILPIVVGIYMVYEGIMGTLNQGRER